MRWSYRTEQVSDHKNLTFLQNKWMDEIKKMALKNIIISYLDPNINVNSFYAPYFLNYHIFSFFSWITFSFSWNTFSHNVFTDILWILHFLRSVMTECSSPCFSNTNSFLGLSSFSLRHWRVALSVVSTVVGFILILVLVYLEKDSCPSFHAGYQYGFLWELRNLFRNYHGLYSSPYFPSVWQLVF